MDVVLVQAWRPWRQEKMERRTRSPEVMGQDVACAACAAGRTTANKTYRASPFQSGKARLSPDNCYGREQGDGEESPNDFALELFLPPARYARSVTKYPFDLGHIHSRGVEP